MGGTAYSETYTYNDSDGSLNTMTTGVGNTLTMGYDGLRRLTSVTGGPVSRQFTYRDIDSTKTTMQVASVTSGGQQYGYTYDSMGNIATYSAPGKGTVTYTYDNQGQLLSAAGDSTYTYTYDGAGNILTANGHTYTYGDSNWKDLLTAFDGQSITYDAIGNPTSYYNGTRWTMTWTGGRNLTTAVAGGNSLSFAYNANGLRTSKTVNGVNYQYYYAGGKLMRMTWGSNTIDFFYDANGTPYALKYNGTVYYYVTNLQGDVIRVVDASGNTVASYEYDPYGKVISATGTLANVNPLRYRGYVYDQETGFYYLQSRYYDPVLSRFVNADSYVSTGDGIIGHNMFAYCNNSPVNALDPTGHAFLLLTAAIGAIAGAVIGGMRAAAKGENVLAGIGIGAAVGGLAGAGLGAVAGVLLAGSALATTASVAAGVNALAATVMSGGFTAGALMIADNVSQAVNKAPQVFWSGGDVAKNASVQIAEQVNGITLEMTKLGQYLEQTNASINAWAAASRNYANVASNVAPCVYSVQNAAGVRISSIWATIEYPLVKCKEIIYSIVG